MEENCLGWKIVYSIPIEKNDLGLEELEPLGCQYIIHTYF